MGVRLSCPASGTQSKRASGLYSTKLPYPNNRRISSSARQIPRNQVSPRQKPPFFELMIACFPGSRIYDAGAGFSTGEGIEQAGQRTRVLSTRFVSRPKLVEGRRVRACAVRLRSKGRFFSD